LLARAEFAGNTIPAALYWTLTDHLGSIREIVDNSGTIADAITYSAFGQITSETDASMRGRYAWTGREIEVETGLQYNRARFYDPAVGRWISKDPMGFDAGDGNLYRYVSNRPKQGIDPSGMDILDADTVCKFETVRELLVFTDEVIGSRIDGARDMIKALSEKSKTTRLTDEEATKLKNSQLIVSNTERLKTLRDRANGADKGKLIVTVSYVSNDKMTQQVAQSAARKGDGINLYFGHGYAENNKTGSLNLPHDADDSAKIADILKSGLTDKTRVAYLCCYPSQYNAAVPKGNRIQGTNNSQKSMPIEELLLSLGPFLDNLEATVKERLANNELVAINLYFSWFQDRKDVLVNPNTGGEASSEVRYPLKKSENRLFPNWK
jgi:RHS repeat-associated protein